jgi:tetratricopeptide (TPR) repeat protein
MLRIRPLFAVAGIFLATSIGRADSEVDSIVQKHWFQATSSHFHAYSCGATQEVAKVIARLEQFRQAYSSLAGAQAVASPPIVVIAFPNEQAMQPFLPLYQGKPASLTAFFNRGVDENLIVLPLGNPFSLELIFHEYTHLLLRRNDRIWPLWLKEGMAEIYSTFEVMPGGQRARIGKPIPRHLHLLVDKPLLPLSQLFAVSHDSPDYNESQHQGIFYAESWLLTHYLMLGDNPDHKARFAQLTALLKQGQTPDEAFTNAFRVPVKLLENELRQYLAREKFQSLDLVLGTGLNGPQAFVASGITPAGTCFRLGDELLRVARPDAAEAYFLEAQKLSPTSPLGYEGLGLLAGERSNSSEAVRWLEEAFKHHSTNFLTHFVYAREKYRLSADRPDTYSALDVGAASEIRAELTKTIKLMPDFGPAHHLLGFFELVQGENLAEAETQLQKAIELEPENQSYLLSLAQAQLINEGPDTSRRTLQLLLKPNVDVKLRTHAQQMIDELDRHPGRKQNQASPRAQRG